MSAWSDISTDQPKAIWSLRDVPDQLICHPFEFTSGWFVTENFTVQASEARPVQYWPFCDDSGRPRLIEDFRRNEVTLPYLVAQLPGWHVWKIYSSQATIEAIVCVLSVALAIVMVMLVLVLCKPRPWRPTLQFVAVIFTFVHMCIVVTTAVRSLEDQFHSTQGYTVAWLFDDLLSLKIKITNIVSNALLLAAQMWLVSTKLIDRGTERYIVWIVGTPAVLLTLVFLALLWFYKPNDVIIFALQYLWAVGIDFVYAMLVVLYAISHQGAALSRSVIAHTFLALLASFTPIAFYMADIAGWWTARSIDQLCAFSTTAALVLVDMWADRLLRHRVIRSHENVMGRRVYEEDDQQLMFVESDSPDSVIGKSMCDTEPDRPASAPQNVANATSPEIPRPYTA